MKIDAAQIAHLQEELTRQFKDLDPKDPSSWPPIPRYMLFVATVVLVVVGLWFGWLNSYDE